METEVRYNPLSNVECRAEEGKMSISGYAVRYGEPSQLIAGEFIEFIDKRAFDGVNLDETFLLYNHNSDYVMGNTRSGTLILENTEKGLFFSASLPNTERARETFELVKRGDVNGMSFGFTVNKDSWDVTKTPIVRNVTEIGELLEVSVVPFPAYESTSVSARALEFAGGCKECRDGVQKILNNPLVDEAKQLLKEVQK